MVGESSLDRTYGPLLTTTLDKILGSGVIQDNVFDANPTLDYFRGGDRIKVVDGGERIRIPVLTGKNSTFKWYSDYEMLNVTPQVGQTTAWYAWKQAAVGISISGMEIRQNKGQAAVADLLKEKVNQAQLSLVDGLATGIFSDGSGSANKQISGLDLMLEDTPGTADSYAQIPKANTAWRNKAASVGAAATNLIPNMRSIFNQCSQGKDGAASKPDFIVGTRAIHEAAEALISPRVRFAPNPSGGADLGVEELMFKGARWIWDDFCTSGDAYVLNGNHVMLFVHAAANFAQTDEGFQKPIDQDALSAQILFMGNLATNNRRKLGKLTGVT